MTYNDRMAQLLIEQHERWQARESVAKGNEPIDTYCRDRRITGEPSECNRNHRATESSWKRSERKRLLTLSTDADGKTHVGSVPFGSQPVKVTRDGQTVTLPQSAFSKERVTMARAATLEAIDRQNRADKRRRISAADLEAIGNIE